MMARSATDFENAGVDGEVDLARDNLCKYVAPRNIPPMAVVMICHAVIDDTIH
jgi:hypothetical protein